MGSKTNEVYAFFDFDGTITSRDTLLDFIIYTQGLLKSILIGARFLPYFVLFKAKLLTNDYAKEKLIEIAFAGTELHTFSKWCDDYCAYHLPKIIKKDALDRIKWHSSENHTVAIVSASCENWIKPWAEKNGITSVIATKLESSKGCLTGRFETRNCVGYQKVVRVREYFIIPDNVRIFGYGDSAGDKEMLSICTDPFYRVFKR